MEKKMYGTAQHNDRRNGQSVVGQSQDVVVVPVSTSLQSQPSSTLADCGTKIPLNNTAFRSPSPLSHNKQPQVMFTLGPSWEKKSNSMFTPLPAPVYSSNKTKHQMLPKI